ncbi:unnamed protein product [Callosobruchus maculatus]|nr:unnamed protein product [Callosobruchus maculatus]
MLRTLEKKILSIVRTPHRGFFVDIGPVVGNSDKIWTISLNTESPKTPLVLLHGLGAGVALWCLNLDALSSVRPVYAIDLLGFGRSSRPNFSHDAVEAERQLVHSIEEWRKEMKLKEFILLGHSLGGFLAASYSIEHPDRVRHLILADPWGFPEKPAEHKDVPLWIKGISYVLKPFNPLAGIRVAGPFGPWFINFVRPDISKKYQMALEDPNLIPEYIYQCNSQQPSGESAFHAMMSDFGWAKVPIVKRIDRLDAKMPVTLLYGARSWVDHSAGDIIKEKRTSSYFKLQVISGAGHHIYADKPEAFNQIVLDACNYTDSTKSNTPMITGPDEQERDEPESDRNS